MSRAPKSRWAPAKALAPGLFCLILLSCAGSRPGETLLFLPGEANVWCDSMPGSPARAIAVMSGRLKNAGTDTLRLEQAEGFIAAAHNGFAIRKFPCQVIGAGGVERKLQILPGDSAEVTLRTPQVPVAPFDIREYPEVRFVVQIRADNGKMYPVRSGILRPFVTR